jgi:alcohol dehydrogenase class IV
VAGSYTYLPLERVVFGRPAAEVAVEEAARLGAKRVFIVASKSLVRDTPLIQGISSALAGRYAGLFDRCIAHTPWPSVIDAANAVREAKPDLILTVGGGTAIDTVKILQIALAHGVTQSDGLDALHSSIGPDGKRIVPRIKPSPVRQVIVPTTLSGAEFSNLAGGTEPRTLIKYSFTGADIGARAVILDAAATVYTPEWLWLSTGIRGVDHAVEAICSIEANPYCDGLAVHALRLFQQHLPFTRTNAHDLEHRLGCQQAAWLAASTIARLSYGASHGIGHALGAATGMPHGYTSCVMLPHVLRYNEPSTARKQKLVSEALGNSAVPACEAIARLISSLELPTRLRDAGVQREQLPAVAEASMKNIWVRNNPHPIRSSDDVMRLLEAAW